jgi:Periplasmic binding protein
MVRTGLLIVGVIAAAALGAKGVAADILIATAGPMTGVYAWAGDRYQRGAGLAVEDLNARGGVLGQRVELVVATTFATPIRLWRSPTNWRAMAWCSSPDTGAPTPQSRPRKSTRKQKF